MLLEGSANRCYWVSSKVAQIYPHPFQATSWAVEAAGKLEIIICANNSLLLQQILFSLTQSKAMPGRPLSQTLGLSS